MSADLKRLQQLAEALGWSIWTRPDDCRDKDWPVSRNFQLFDKPSGAGGTVLSFGSTLAPIRARLEEEYRELAKQAQNARRVYLKISNWCGHDTSDEASYLTRIADELESVEEPTMVEKLKEKKAGFPEGTDSPIVVVLDALIDLYERDSRTRKEGE